MRLIARELSRNLWECHPEGDDDIAARSNALHFAVAELLEAIGLEWRKLGPASVNATDDGTFILEWRTTCPECNGTGQYVGLAVVEPCQHCDGSGQTA